MSDCKKCKEYTTEKHYCPKFCDVIEHTLEEAYQQGRADAIDDAKKELYRFNFDTNRDLEFVIDTLNEQIKEQKNGIQ